MPNQMEGLSKKIIFFDRS